MRHTQAKCATSAAQLPCIERIIDYLGKQEFPIPSWQISKDLSLKSGSTRRRLTDLWRRGVVSRPYRGHYELSQRLDRVRNITDGVGDRRRALLHNVTIQVDGVVFSCKVPDFVRDFGDVKIRILFGKERGKITGTIAKDAGLTWSEWVLSVEVFLGEIGRVLGRVIAMDEVYISSFELADDFLNRRLDSVKCLTLRDFLGNLERIYQKGDDIRREIKTSQPMSVVDLMAFYQGGLTSYSIFQSQGLLIQELRNTNESIDNQTKYLFPLLRDQVSINKMLLKKLGERDLEIEEMRSLLREIQGKLSWLENCNF